MLLDFVLRAISREMTHNRSTRLSEADTPHDQAQGHPACLSAEIGLLYDAWSDIDAALAGVSAEQMLASHDGGSSFAWTLGHTANILDAWINVRFQQRQPHPVIGNTDLAMGGSGTVDDWSAIQQGVREVRTQVRSYLDALDPGGLAVARPYDGSISEIQGREVTLGYAVLRNVAHHYYHVGEIATTRVRLGQQVAPFPGPLVSCLGGQEHGRA